MTGGDGAGLDPGRQSIDPGGQAHYDNRVFGPADSPAQLKVALRALEPLLATVEAFGHDAAALAQASEISPEMRADPDCRVSATLVDRLWGEAVVVCEEPCLGLRVAEGLGPASFDVFGYTIAHSPTWGLGLRRVLKYFRMLSESAGYRLERAGDRAKLVCLRHPILPRAGRALADFNLAVVQAYGQRMLGARWRVRRVCFQHAEPPEVAAYLGYFGVRPEFASPELSVEFDRALLDATVESADPSLGAILVGVADAALAKLPEPDDWPARVRGVLAPRLAMAATEGLPTRAVVARELGIGERSLQRRLSASSTSFQGLLTQLRLDIAATHLEGLQMSIAEIAYLLGYSETAAFHRAFRRQHGLTPAQYRAKRSGQAKA